MSPWSHILPFNSILIHDHSLLYVCEWLKWDQPSLFHIHPLWLFQLQLNFQSFSSSIIGQIKRTKELYYFDQETAANNQLPLKKKNGETLYKHCCWHDKGSILLALSYGALETLASPCPLSGTAPTPRPPCILPVCSTWSNRQVNVTDLDDFSTFSSCWTSAFWIKGSIVCFSDAYFREITQMGTYGRKIKYFVCEIFP